MIALGGFLAERCLALVVLLLAAYSLGRFLLRRLPFAGAVEEFTFSAAIGLGLLAAAFLSLAAPGILNRKPAILLLVLALAAGFPFLRNMGRRALAPPHRRKAFLLAGLAILAAAPAILLASYPPLLWDELMYHLPLAKAYARTHHVGPQPFIRFWMLPQLNEMLFAGALLLRNDLAAHSVELAFFLLAGLALFSTGRRLQSPRAGMWAAGLWIGSPLALRLGTVAYVDMGVAGFSALAGCAFLIAAAEADSRWLALAGAFAGFAAAVKYDGLAVVLILTGGALLLPGGRRKGAAWLFSAALLCAAPWYLRTYLLTANPVAPFLGRIFGFRVWDRGDLASLQWNLRAAGLPRTLTSFLMLSWHWLAHPGRFGNVWETSALPFFALLPLLLLAPLGLRLVRRAGVGVLLYVLFWFFAAQDARFLLPAFPILLLAIAVWGDRLLSRIESSVATRHWLGAAGFLASLAPGIVFATRQFDRLGPPPATEESRRALLEHRFPSLPCYEALNRRYGSHYRLYAFHDEAMTYFADGTMMGDWFGPARYDNIDTRTGMSLFRSLRDLGAQFLAFRRSPIAMSLPEDRFFQEHFHPVCAAPGFVLYRLTSAPAAGGPRLR